ncbi:hypothetical protein [Peterkaempfera sp. SMS 1(5)a]|uniref:hypothetical protein n=1 Tax=Peterkaempfera podocarpi TaxID=3232308 RepID=UPI0036718731
MSVHSPRTRRLKAMLGAAPLLAGALVAGPMASGQAHAAHLTRDINFHGTVNCAKFKDDSTPGQVRAIAKNLGSGSADVTPTDGTTGTYDGLTVTVADSATKVAFSATCDPAAGGASHVIKKNFTVTKTVADGDDLEVNLP